MLPKPLTFKNGHPVCIPSGQAFDIERTIRQSIFDSEPVQCEKLAEFSRRADRIILMGFWATSQLLGFY